MNRKQLAEKMNCSPQYISKVLKGRENLSLETLSKIEMALGISIIKEEPITVWYSCKWQTGEKICYQISRDLVLKLW